MEGTLRKKFYSLKQIHFLDEKISLFNKIALEQQSKCEIKKILHLDRNKSVDHAV